MLNQIKPAAYVPREETVQDALLGCHMRIRHFTEMACKLAHAHAAEPEQVQRAAAEVHRYFTVALPLHEADENISLHPRLIKALSGESVKADASTSPETALLRRLGGPAADAMVEQHESIDQLVERLVPLCTILRSQPAKLEELSQELHEVSAALSEIFTAHLEMEEKTVFPAMEEVLTGDELDEIRREMRERRA
jgi:iron-sulfur cluster repair protein YtfE (RIC family)